MNLAGCASTPDNLNALTEAIEAAMDDADCVILTGGVSAGERDYVPEAMTQAGLAIHFTRLAIKPGKPTVYATAPGKVAFGLPGNPLAVFVMFHLIVRYARAMLMGTHSPLRRFRLPLAKSFSQRHSDRCAYVPGRLDHSAAVEPIEWHGSAHLNSLRDADGFFVVPAGQGELSSGHNVDFFAISGCFR